MYKYKKDPYKKYIRIECKKDIQDKNIEKMSIGICINPWNVYSVLLRVYHFNNSIMN